MKERLQKLLAQANIASRRASEDLITRGRVRVNGAVAHVGDKADPAVDVIEVDGTRLNFEARKRIFIALNKPKHVLTTDKPHRTDKRQTVAELIGRDEHLFSIGRLDADSEGLVVMTNDGETAQRLSHPRYRHTKTYRVEVFGLPTAETLEKWQQGIYLEEGKAAPCIVEIVRGSVKGSVLRIVMTEGKKRQIRRVAAALGHPVERLVRTQIGMFALGDLAPGATHELNAKEILALSTPAPEIKLLRSRSARRTDEKAATPAEEKPRTARTRPSETLDAPSNPRRAPRPRLTDSQDEPQRRVRRTRPDDAAGEAPKRPARRTRSSAAQDEQPERRPRRSAAPDDEKRRSPRSQADKGKRRVPTNPPPDDSPDEEVRTPRSKPSGAPTDKRRTPRTKPAGSPAGKPAAKRRPSRPPGKKGGTGPARKPGNRKPSGRKSGPR